MHTGNKTFNHLPGQDLKIKKRGLVMDIGKLHFSKIRNIPGKFQEIKKGSATMAKPSDYSIKKYCLQ